MSDALSARNPDSPAEPELRQVVHTPPAPRDARARPEQLRLPPPLPRRQAPWLLVEVDGSPGAHRGLVWALREAARREASVVAVTVLDTPTGDPREGSVEVESGDRLAATHHLEAQVLRAVAETGVQGRTSTAVLDRPVHEALTAATRGADLVVVGATSKAVLRHAVPLPPRRRLPPRA